MEESISWKTGSQKVHRVLQESTGESSEADIGTAPAPKQASKAAPDRSHLTYEDKGVQADPQYEDKGAQADAETSQSGTKRKRMSVVVSVEIGAWGSPPRKLKKNCNIEV